jgi:hypothetical protein
MEKKKLQFNREVIRQLRSPELAGAQGGMRKLPNHTTCPAGPESAPPPPPSQD